VEVVPAVEWRPLPHAQDCVKGVINYRATLVPLLDFALLLGQTPRPLQRSARILIVRIEKGGGSLLDEAPVGPLRQETPDSLIQPPETVTEKTPDPISDAHVGLLVERLLGSEDLDFGDPTSSDTSGLPQARFLGPVALTHLGTIQLIDVAGLPTTNHA
jgi:chemotaxis-related protein WspB